MIVILIAIVLCSILLYSIILTKGTRELDASRSGKQTLAALFAGVAGRVVDDAGRRIRQNGMIHSGCVQIVKGVLAGGIASVARRALEAVDSLDCLVCIGSVGGV